MDDHTVINAVQNEDADRGDVFTWIRVQSNYRSRVPRGVHQNMLYSDGQ